MGAVTYPEEKVAKFISLNFVPVQIQSSNKEMMQRFAVSWTPTLIVLDGEGREHFRAVGFFSPEEMVATFAAAKGRWALDTDQLADARALFEEVMNNYPESDAAAMATFFGGVTRYKMDHNPQVLRESYELLKEKFPHSIWTKQADHYRLISK
jgi:TolA-binding protein